MHFSKTLARYSITNGDDDGVVAVVTASFRRFWLRVATQQEWCPVRIIESYHGWLRPAVPARTQFAVYPKTNHHLHEDLFSSPYR